MKRVIDCFKWAFLAFVLGGFVLSACTSEPGDGLILDTIYIGPWDTHDLPDTDTTTTDPPDTDTCLGLDDDVDSDGIPDCRDDCVDIHGLADNMQDAEGDRDGDGVCNGADLCGGFDDKKDADGDGLPDDCDKCPTVTGESLCFHPCFEMGGDEDDDGICDPVDACLGDSNPDCCKLDGDCQVNEFCDLSGGGPKGLCTTIVDTEAPSCTRHTDCAEGEYCASLLEHSNEIEPADNCPAEGDWSGPMPEGICRPKLEEHDCINAPLELACSCDLDPVISTCALEVIGTRLRNFGLCPLFPCESDTDCPPRHTCSGNCSPNT